MTDSVLRVSMASCSVDTTSRPPVNVAMTAPLGRAPMDALPVQRVLAGLGL
jgi:hypothetical protein